MQKMARVSTAALLAARAKETPPTATLAKEASSYTREHAGKPAPRGTWPWTGCASIALRCVRTASMRRHAKVHRRIPGESVAVPSHRPWGPTIEGAGVSMQNEGNQSPYLYRNLYTSVHIAEEIKGESKALPLWILPVKTDESPSSA